MIRYLSLAACVAILTSCVIYAPSATVIPTTREAQGPEPTKVTDHVEAYMESAVRYDHFSGSILIARDGVPVVSRAFGMANYELNVPNTPETVYRIASLTKQFTAMLIMQLQEQGKLRVSDPLCSHFADCPAAWRQVTIHHLLTHTSGIPDYSGLPTWDEDLGRRRHSHDGMVALFRDLPMAFTPGAKYAYSNSGYYLLGLVIERVSVAPYGEVLRQRITAPLGMARTQYAAGRELIPNRAAGYSSVGTSFVGAPFFEPSGAFAGGGMLSTTEDLLRWDRALYSGRLISRSSRDAMFTPFLDGYAYGWQVGQRLGRAATDHSGSYNGFSSYILRFPAERVTVIVLSNSDRASGTRTAMNLARIAFGEAYELPQLSLRATNHY